MSFRVRLTWCFLPFVMILSASKVVGENVSLQTGAELTEEWLPILEGQRVGLLVNHTSQIDGLHLIDTMLALGVKIERIFAPEHGFRGDSDAGALIKDGVDAASGIPVISLYGASKKPSSAQLEGLDVIVFDIQDVGVRFYTYISSMHYMMEACAENGVKMLVFDRPNPNGDYVDGPVLKDGFTSFVGMHPIPVVHGLTVGELALMINGEGWLANGVKCDLEVVKMKGYTHDLLYSPPVKPSPNLPNLLSIRLYPSLCFFEGSDVSVGRGTELPFQVIGYPDPRFGEFSFIPVSTPGAASEPLQQDRLCYGLDLRETEGVVHRFSLKYLLLFYKLSGRDDNFISRPRFFNLLAGSERLAQQIVQGLSEEEIRASWRQELEEYCIMRCNYLLYP